MDKLTEDEIKSILVSLAKFHASNYALKNECRIKGKLLNAPKLASMEALKAFLDSNPSSKMPTTDILKKIEDATVKFESLSKYTVCHGNLVRNNILFDPNKRCCKFLNSSDLYLPVLFDVVEFLAETNVKNLYDFENKLKFYTKQLHELSSEMVVLSKEVVKNSYQIMTLFFALQEISKSSQSIATVIDKLIDALWINPAILEDCIEVMKKELKTAEFVITNYQQTPFDERVGFLGEHSILTITTNNSSQDYSFFVKSTPETIGQRDFINEMNGAFKESRFFGRYLTLLKQQNIHLLDDYIPTCYLSNEEMLILQDLSRENYVSFASRSSLGLEYTKAALKSLAKFHASGLILEETISRQLQQKYRLINDFQEEFKEGWFSGQGKSGLALKSAGYGAAATLELIGAVYEINGKSTVELMRESLSKQPIFVQPSDKYRNTICHGDLWTKNLMFKTDKNGGIHCVLVDFQLLRYGPPAQDIMSFLHLIGDREYRKHHLVELLDYYFNELKENLDDYNCGDIISRDEFENSCKYYKQFALTQRVSHSQVVSLSGELATEAFNDQEKARKFLFDIYRYDFVKDTCSKDAVYKEWNCGAVKELLDFIIGQL